VIRHADINIDSKNFLRIFVKIDPGTILNLMKCPVNHFVFEAPILKGTNEKGAPQHSTE
jgi:hypothetical protein